MPAPFRAYPYAAKAVIQHDWQDPILSVWVTFRHPMDQTVQPANNLWICKVDGGAEAVTVSAWQDEWTLLLTVPAILALPGTVTIKYNGPDSDLRTTWDKQWEPFGPILSIRIPYLWEDIIVVDTVNRRVGINAPPTAHTFEVYSADFTDHVDIYHDNTDAFLTWDDGSLILQSDEGTNTNAQVFIRGKGTGRGIFRVYDQDNSDYLNINMFDGTGFIFTGGASPGNLLIQHIAHANISLFSSATTGETRELKIYGFRAADAKRALEIGVGVDAADTASFDGLSNYLFDGKIQTNDDIEVTGETITNQKSKMTLIGGFAIMLTNKTGNPSVAGDVVENSAGTADAVSLAGIDCLDAIGVFLDSGIADGSEAWIVVMGIADVHMDAAGCALGDRIVTSATPGRGEANNAPSIADHFKEIGHTLEAAAANANARIVLHFL